GLKMAAMAAAPEAADASYEQQEISITDNVEAVFLID
ncbi:hypothetical protein G113_09160, partial [Aeromonas molluscorum 848]